MNMYELINGKEEDIEKLINYKLKSIYEYSDDMSETEKEKINDYVKNNIPKQLKKYKLIKVNNEKIGCVLVYEKDDGVLLDEIYIEENFRNMGIGSDIINKILNENEIVYLWVYKLNKNAIKLYEKMGFIAIIETETRYYMKFEKW